MKHGPNYVGARKSSIPEDERYRPDGTDEWYTTEDGYAFTEGDRLFNYYDCEWVLVGKMGYGGWFDTQRCDPDGNIEGRGPSLNSVRMSKNLPDWYTGGKAND